MDGKDEAEAEAEAEVEAELKVECEEVVIVPAVFPSYLSMPTVNAASIEGVGVVTVSLRKSKAALLMLTLLSPFLTSLIYCLSDPLERDEIE